MGTPVLSAGTTLQCSFGAAPVPMMTLPTTRVIVGGTPVANMMSDIPFCNIMPFGVCISPANPAYAASLYLVPPPCTPLPPAPWMLNAMRVMAQTPIGTTTDMIMCAYAGIIKPIAPSQFQVMSSAP